MSNRQFSFIRLTVTVVAILLVAAALYGGNFLRSVAPFASGFSAHTFCSNYFISERSFVDIKANDLSPLQQRLTRSRVDGNSIVTEFGIWPVNYTSVAVYRPGLGCGQLAGETMANLEGPSAIERDIPDALSPSLTWPELTLDGIDQDRLTAALDSAFSESEDNIENRQNTRAIVVFHNDKLIAERYANGFEHNTPLNSWSMTKSATSALIGILVGQGRIDLNAPASIESWQGDNDPRRNVTIGQILQMTSGLDFNEGYESDPVSDVNFMLFNSRDLPAFAATFPLSAEPGERWSYQTANPVLLGKIIRDTITEDEEYYHFAQRELFNKLGMRNSYLQADGSGTFVGGAFLFGTARDWARFGLLYLNDGIVNGERILPEGWVDYSRSPTDASLKGRAYGAQFWLNTAGDSQMMPSIPADAYAARGHYGQSVVIIPSRNLVVVRMGQTYKSSAWDMEAFVAEVLAALPKKQQQVLH